MRAWGIKRSGIKWSATRLAKRKQAIAAIEAHADGITKGLTGEKLYDHIKAAAKLHPDTDPGTLYRIIRHGQEITEKAKNRSSNKRARPVA